MVYLGGRSNRVRQSGTLNQSFTVDANTNRINSSGFSYDSAGRMTAGNWGGFTRTLTWDPDGKLQTYTDGSTPTITYSLDPFGRRIKATPTSGSPTYYFYGSAEGGHPVSEYTTAWQTDVVGDARVIATADSAAPPNVTYLANDYLGTTRMTVSGSGSPSAVATYYPYGEEGVSITSEYKLTSQIRENSGIDHFWHRKYAGGPARWLTPDNCHCTAQGYINTTRLQSPQSLNTYSYVINRPADLIDARGCYYGDPSYGGSSYSDIYVTFMAPMYMYGGCSQCEAQGYALCNQLYNAAADRCFSGAVKLLG